MENAKLVLDIFNCQSFKQCDESPLQGLGIGGTKTSGVARGWYKARRWRQAERRCFHEISNSGYRDQHGAIHTCPRLAVSLPVVEGFPDHSRQFGELFIAFANVG